MDILLIEDNPGDVRLLQEAFGDCGIHHRLAVVTDGVEAMQYLRREEAYPGSIRPDLILLDLNLPGKDGRDILLEIKTDADLRRIPVVILSTSGAEADILAAYDRQANCYIRKPLDLDAFFAVAESILRFWSDTVKLPAKDAS
ncbi:response regulator [Desulfosarcina sp.]|uniref:response regulator n=1 Tax=Desulfosarcina sp. TaxID=2027861 RepID=UPI003568BC74